jgi:hypothetical protein
LTSRFVVVALLRLGEYSLFLFGEGTRFRLAVRTFANSRFFRKFIMLTILVNCIFLAMDSPGMLSFDSFAYLLHGVIVVLGTGESPLQSTLDMGDVVFLAIFITEVVVKVISEGFVWGRKGYLQSPWNIVDFTIVLAGMLTISVDVHSSLSGIRAIRVLRPLRTITALPELRRLVVLLLKAIPALLNAVFLCLFLYLLFGLIALQSFKGKLRSRCVNYVTGIMTDKVCGYYGCATNETCTFIDSNPNYGVTSFDNLGVSFLTIFQCTTLEGWTDLMYNLMDALHPVVCLYFIAMVVMLSFFVLNLTLAVIKANFEEDGAEDAALATLRGLRSERAPPQARRSRVTALLYKISHAGWFDKIFLVLILINTILLAAEYHGQSDLQTEITDTANFVLTILFAVEMMVKLLGNGYREYLRKGMFIS